MAEITVGDVVRVDATFKVDGTNTDPTTIMFKYRSPAGATVSYENGTDAELVKDATGKYHVDIIPDTAGTWRVGWVGSGDVRSFRSTLFEVVSGGMAL